MPTERIEFAHSPSGFSRWFSGLVFALVLGLSAPVSMAVDLTAYTEDWPPYNYEEGKEVRGIATDILRAACTSADLSCDIQLVPWARAYKVTQESPNTLVYTTARKPSRESEFIWVGPILPRTTWVYGRTGGDVSVSKIGDLAAVRVGIVRGEASHQDLRDAGVPERAFRLESSNAKVLRLLNHRIVDVMVDTEIGMAWNLQGAGLAADTVKRLFKMSDEGGYYFALNPQSEPKVAQRLQQAVDKLRRDGKIRAIVRQYSGLANHASN
jgi:polar amino acid transport system substrate-binding protein